MIVTYRTYIKYDYKPVDPGCLRRPQRRARSLKFTALGLLIPVGFSLAMISPPEPGTHKAVPADFDIHTPTAAVDTQTGEGSASLPDFVSPGPPAADPVDIHSDSRRLTVPVEAGDSLTLIFDRLGFSAQTLHLILASGDQTHRLRDLLPGQELEFLRDDGGELTGLRFEPNLTEVLEITKQNSGFVSSVIATPLRTIVSKAEAEIVSSLFVAGQEAGLSDNLIMQLAGIFGWDIDFVMDVRVGDKFKVLYEEQFKENRKVGNGMILAAEFRNRGKIYRAIRYIGEDGRADYYADSGASMRKAFLRTPLSFTRISSAFDLRRKHPILNRIRAHRGVDYAAPTGTPVKATGDGTVVHIGSKGGYGRSIVLRHGGDYGTLYAHMSRYAAGLRPGSRVSQGQIIGYVGSSGLATGPHLHYEFQINGTHRNPLIVPLPRAPGISEQQRPHFYSQSAPLLAQLDQGAAPAEEILAMDGGSDNPDVAH